jgi:heme/copper-type cytochrome/quinol oxidase subunit 1
MNWEMLSAIGQVVAAVGVIPSLIYLAAQIREQNKERRRAGINTLTTQWGELVKTGQESREFAEVFLRGVQSFQRLDGPDEVERTMIDYFAYPGVREWWATYGLDETSNKVGSKN